MVSANSLGAEALGLGDQIGSIVPGLQPGCRITREQVRSRVLCVRSITLTNVEEVRKFFEPYEGWILGWRIGKQTSCHFFVKQLSPLPDILGVLPDRYGDSSTIG